MKTSEIIESIKSCGTVHECKSMTIFPNAFITDLKKNNKKTKQKKTNIFQKCQFGHTILW